MWVGTEDLENRVSWQVATLALYESQVVLLAELDPFVGLCVN